MSVTVTYKNLAFQRSLESAYIRSIYGAKNYKAKNFSGIKTASRPWGWQFRQFVHPDSTYDVVYVRQRFSIRNHFNNSRQYYDTVFDLNNPLQHKYERTIDSSGNVMPIGTPVYEPSRAAFEVTGGLPIGSPSNKVSSVTSPTLAQSDMVGGSGRYTADYELLEPFGLNEVIGDVRARIAQEPNPDYDDPTNTRFYSDNWSYSYQIALNGWGWGAYAIKRAEPIPTVPYLLGYMRASAASNDSSQRALNYYVISAQKIGITIFNTRLNQLTIERYCRSEWTRTAQSGIYSFSAHRNCQMVTNEPGPRPFNILVDLPSEDPLVQTNGVPVGGGSLGQNDPFPIGDKMIGNEVYFPGYPPEGYPTIALPPPGPCCVLV